MPDTPRMIERAPTGDEDRRWTEFKNMVDKAQRLSTANVLRAAIYDREKQIADKFGFELPDLSAEQKTALQNLADTNKLLKAIYLVERQDLGVRFEPNGDITIMAPSWYTQEQIQSYGLGGFFIPIAIGIVVLAGIIGTLRYVNKTNEALQKKYDLAIDRADAGMCADPDSELCQKWEADKKTFNFNRTKTVIEEITEGAKEIGKTAKAGIGAGLAIGIALALWRVFATK